MQERDNQESKESKRTLRDVRCLVINDLGPVPKLAISLSLSREISQPGTPATGLVRIKVHVWFRQQTLPLPRRPGPEVTPTAVPVWRDSSKTRCPVLRPNASGPAAPETISRASSRQCLWTSVVWAGVLLVVQSIYFSAAERVRAFFLPTTPLHPTDDSPMPSFEKNHFLKCSIIDRNKIGI